MLEISTGATNQNQGQYAFSVSGVNPEQVYDAAGKLMAKLYEYPGFATVSSDFFNNTPNLDIDIRRDQARMYGVSETRILSLLRTAYSQNYVYLIKKPQDQYQVILEVEDSARAHPEDLSLLYIRSDDGKNLVPLKALVTWKTSLGPQAVNHLNQFTSVTLFFNLKPGVAIGDATDYIAKTAAADRAAHAPRGAPGRGAHLPQHGPRPDDPDGARRVRHVRDPGDPLRELRAPADGALDAARPRWWAGSPRSTLFGEQASLYAFVGMFMLMGIVKKNGIMIVDFARHRVEAGEAAEQAIHDASMDRFRPIMMTTLAAVFGAVPDRAGLRRRRRLAAAARPGDRRRPAGLAVHHALRDAGDLPLPRGVPGRGCWTARPSSARERIARLVSTRAAPGECCPRLRPSPAGARRAMRGRAPDRGSSGLTRRAPPHSDRASVIGAGRAGPSRAVAILR